MSQVMEPGEYIPHMHNVSSFAAVINTDTISLRILLKSLTLNFFFLPLE